MNYDVTFTDTALKNLARYPTKDQQAILKNIKQLSENPLTKSNVKKLADYLDYLHIQTVKNKSHHHAILLMM
jgi:mRNA-degrading endonuclease RelE of RelBE toxin-antitoxin system